MSDSPNPAPAFHSDPALPPQLTNHSLPCPPLPALSFLPAADQPRADGAAGCCHWHHLRHRSHSLHPHEPQGGWVDWLVGWLVGWRMGLGWHLQAHGGGACSPAPSTALTCTHTSHDPSPAPWPPPRPCPLPPPAGGPRPQRVLQGQARQVAHGGALCPHHHLRDPGNDPAPLLPLHPHTGTLLLLRCLPACAAAAAVRPHV